ncbi:DUF7003 family protein [Phaeocystidibacter luteus]|uniref:Uncharacterized protein n=1 Tax=Phaeocystidibacter luteus TaxID=911197 RepID=A0A6N6RKE2_9FLAO|nr:hypothetical protein [Phaeocystidibacter luteus]KAB2809986.1 hypothetical protein F8C67_08895 [Phaeocystidibacter luteus]
MDGENRLMKDYRSEILSELDSAFIAESGLFFPDKKSNTVAYHFFPDLEDGYKQIAGSKIHLYGSGRLWAIVFETNGYHTRQGEAISSLCYFGNCFRLEKSEAAGSKYISNLYQHTLISEEELQRIELQIGDEDEAFERIDPRTTSVFVNGQYVPFESNRKKYVELGIEPTEDNPSGWIEFGEFVRFLHETNPIILELSDSIIEEPFEVPLNKILTLDKFHYRSIYDKSVSPSEQEMYQMIADVLVSGDENAWSPTSEANNDWRNWESGML